MARFGDGLAVDADLVHAAEAAAIAARAPLGGLSPDLACVFVCGSDPDQVEEALQRAAGVLRARTVIGCSASGVIGAAQGIEATSSVSVWAAVLPGVRVRAFHLEVIRTSGGMAILGLPEGEAADEVAVVIADPYSFPADGFVEQANDALKLPLVGGLATGNRGAGSTRLLIDGRVVDRGAVGVVLGGPVGAQAMVSQGCRPVGPAMTVTAAEGNLLLELAGVPAITKLEQVISSLSSNDQALASRGLEVGIAMNEYVEEHERGDFLVRGILGIDKARGAIAIGDVVPVGRTVRFQVRDAASADDDLRAMLGELRTGFSAFEGALLFSCNGRGSNLFTSADHDVLAMRQGLATSGIAGFFAGGEIGPVGNRNHLHGFSASVLVFGSPRPDAEIDP
ncbi:MAG TPA: FIST N-terminal domain-containing protein [Acidothermaceae bacterium]|nr:FIST N-terminal domain-containing protein [Acidothermaceae bacterium]